jgi:PPOX class probable F420-dependent enzyme
MTADELPAFLTAGRRRATIATLMADGHPHAVPVNFVFHDETISFLTSLGSIKGRNLTRDPRVAITIEDDEHPCAFVAVRGRAELTEDHNQCVEAGTRLGRRYLGPEGGPEYVQQFVHHGTIRVSVSLEAARVLAMTDLFG